ncbi:MAG: glycosyltransferase family 39 protein [Thermomicrobiales bacterium]
MTILLMVAGVYAVVVARPELIAGAAPFGSLILYGLGSAAIVLATTLGRPLLERRLALSSPAGAFVTTALAVGLAAIAGYLAYGRTLADRTADITVLWLVAVALVVTVALAGRLHRPGHATSPHTTTSPRRPAIVAAVAGVLAIAALTRFLNLMQFPSASAHDEWFFILDARGFRDGVLANQFRTYDVVVQSDVWTWVDGLLSRPFPDEPSSYRLLGAITGTLVVVATILLGRRTLGTPTALAGGLIVATFPALLWASRTAMANILDPLVLTIALWLTDRVLSTRDRRDALACGIVLGVGYFGYFSARAFPFVVAVCMLGLLFPRPTRRSMLDYVRLGAWTAAGFVVTAAPMLAYAASNPDEFFLRVKAMSDAVVAPAFTDRLRLIIQGLAIPLTIPQGVSIHATTTQVNMLGSVATLFFGIGVVSWLVAAAAQMFRRSWSGIAGRRSCSWRGSCWRSLLPKRSAWNPIASWQSPLSGRWRQQPAS